MESFNILLGGFGCGAMALAVADARTAANLDADNAYHKLDGKA
jgi:hypothetical protein